MKQHHSRHQPFRRIRVLLPLMALLVAMLAAFVWLDNAVNRGVTFAPEPPIPWTDVPPVGMNLYSIQFEPDRAKVTRRDA